MDLPIAACVANLASGLYICSLKLQPISPYEIGWHHWTFGIFKNILFCSSFRSISGYARSYERFDALFWSSDFFVSFCTKIKTLASPLARLHGGVPVVFPTLGVSSPLSAFCRGRRAAYPTRRRSILARDLRRQIEALYIRKARWQTFFKNIGRVWQQQPWVISTCLHNLFELPAKTLPPARIREKCVEEDLWRRTRSFSKVFANVRPKFQNLFAFAGGPETESFSSNESFDSPDVTSQFFPPRLSRRQCQFFYCILSESQLLEWGTPDPQASLFGRDGRKLKIRATEGTRDCVFSFQRCTGALASRISRLWHIVRDWSLSEDWKAGAFLVPYNFAVLQHTL